VELKTEIKHSRTESGNVYYRLIALWVLCEAMLGGVIHAAKIPVSGLVVGSCAVICICLIAFNVPQKGAIIKATIIVAVFKMMLSPQSPPPAYFAVFFQGLMGELFFWKRNFYRISCLLLAVTALLESALQRIIVLTIVYGNNFWKAINSFLNDLTGQKEFTNYSLLIGIAYVMIHLLAGMLVGWWAGVIPKKAAGWQEQFCSISEQASEPVQKTITVKKRKRRWLKTGVLVIWILLVLLYIQSHFQIGRPVLPANLPVQILIRSVIVIFAWYFIVSPLVSLGLKKWLQKKRLRSNTEIQQIAELLPGMQQLVAAGWKNASKKKGIKKIIVFSKIVLAGLLHHK
jgi:hypothetical protein